MKRVLVPLDGSALAETIIPDARRLAGADGELILVRELSHGGYAATEGVSTDANIEAGEAYLQGEAAALRGAGVKVQSHSLILGDPADAIDEAARINEVDAIAIATHGRRPLGRLVRGGVAWRALAHSPVPVLLRHVDAPASPQPIFGGERAILVPLDGSAYAETALRPAEELAREWHAPIFLLRVIPDLQHESGRSLAAIPLSTTYFEDERDEAQAYLERIAGELDAEVHCRALIGSVIGTIAEQVKVLNVTDVVLATHGRTGLTRVVMGSITDELVHDLRISMLVIPAMAAPRFAFHPAGHTAEPVVAH
jgi:nucleotide-binding universal stress UspA family protein